MATGNLLDLAKSFRQWAIDNQLKDRGIDARDPSVTYNDALVDSFQITGTGSSILRKKLISLVAIKRRENKILIFTTKKITVVEERLLPKAFGGVEVEFLHGGVPVAQSLPNLGVAYFQSSTGAYCCGSSIHPARHIGAGTMGALVRDSHGTIFGLTNNHVSGDCNFSDLDTQILAPGHIDIQPGGIDPFTIGYHTATLPMVSGSPDNVNATDNSDAAIFRIKDAGQVSSMQGVYHDTPTKTVPLMDGMLVDKVGRTTGHRQGRVLAQVVGFEPCQYSINYLNGGKTIVYFDSSFIVFETPGQGRFCEPGDSGSLVTTTHENERKAGGLLYAGNTEGYTFVLPIEPILSNLGVSLISGHNL